MTMNSSKIKKHSVISKLDSNDKRDSKKGMLKSSLESYDHISKNNMEPGKTGNVKANDKLQTILEKEYSTKNGGV